MANYKADYDLEWSDLFMNKCNEVTRNQSKSRRYAKRQASKATRRAIKKQTEIEVPVTKYVSKCEAYWEGRLVESEMHNSFNVDEIEEMDMYFEFKFCGYDVKITTKEINVR